MLVRVFYVSAVVGTVSDVDIQMILGAAQVRNRRLDVTGMIAQSDDHFAQVIEGHSADVAQVMERVRRDPRHTQIRILLEEPILLRQFARWSMALARRDDMAAELVALHHEKCPDEAHARELMQRLMTPPAD